MNEKEKFLEKYPDAKKGDVFVVTGKRRSNHYFTEGQEIVFQGEFLSSLGNVGFRPKDGGGRRQWLRVCEFEQPEEQSDKKLSEKEKFLAKYPDAKKGDVFIVTGNKESGHYYVVGQEIEFQGQFYEDGTREPEFFSEGKTQWLCVCDFEQRPALKKGDPCLVSNDKNHWGKETYHEYVPDVNKSRSHLTHTAGSFGLWRHAKPAPKTERVCLENGDEIDVPLSVADELREKYL